MWSIFVVKLNYIVIFEKLCNSYILLKELFMICDQLAFWDPLTPGGGGGYLV